MAEKPTISRSIAMFKKTFHCLGRFLALSGLPQQPERLDESLSQSELIVLAAYGVPVTKAQNECAEITENQDSPRR